VRLYCPLPDNFTAHNVQGDGRCGHRAIAKDFGISCQDVMREVLKLMVAHGDLFTVAEILAVASATGPRSRAAWRSNHHLSLLSQMGALFPRGIAVLKFEIDRAFIQFQGNGDVRVVSHLPPEGVCILGLVTQRMYHFVLLQGRKLALSSSPAMDPEVASHGGGNDFICSECPLKKITDDTHVQSVSGGATDLSALHADVSHQIRRYFVCASNFGQIAAVSFPMSHFCPCSPFAHLNFISALSKRKAPFVFLAPLLFSALRCKYLVHKFQFSKPSSLFSRSFSGSFQPLRACSDLVLLVEFFPARRFLICRHCWTLKVNPVNRSVPVLRNFIPIADKVVLPRLSPRIQIVHVKLLPFQPMSIQRKHSPSCARSKPKTVAFSLPTELCCCDGTVTACPWMCLSTALFPYTRHRSICHHFQLCARTASVNRCVQHSRAFPKAPL
jgi:hypothetical protein